MPILVPTVDFSPYTFAKASCDSLRVRLRSGIDKPLEHVYNIGLFFDLEHDR